MTGTDNQLQELISKLLAKQEVDGLRLQADEFWTDAFHPGGPWNVGQDVTNAAHRIRRATESLLEDSHTTITELALRISKAKAEFAIASEDPDGFGLATFNEVLHGLLEHAAERGEVVPHTYRELIGSSSLYVAAASYVGGRTDGFAALIKSIAGCRSRTRSQSTRSFGDSSRSPGRGILKWH